MVSLNMSGPFDLTSNEINRVISEISPGNYALGFTYKDGVTFMVKYIGRSDINLNSRLHEWVGVNRVYSQFKCSYAKNPEGAFIKECKNFHDFGGTQSLDNDVHPARPQNSSIKCPICGQ